MLTGEQYRPKEIGGVEAEQSDRRISVTITLTSKKIALVLIMCAFLPIAYKGLRLLVSIF